jgi:cytochrome c-type biogenesis protein CcmH/NrfF
VLAVCLALAALLTAQTAAEKPNPDVRRVGARLACQCGCKDSVATCSMLECSFCKPVKERIARMQAVGMSDQQIIDAMITEYGANVYLSPPSPLGWIVPYGFAAFGLVVIWLFIRKYRRVARPAVAGVPGDAALEQYGPQIEKDIENLD